MFSSPNAKMAYWLLAAFFAEAMPITLVWLLAIEHDKEPLNLIMDYLGAAGPIIIGFGTLVAGLGDVAIEDSSIANVRNYLPHLLPMVGCIWFGLNSHLIAKAHPGPIEKGILVTITACALICAGLAKRDMWRRHHISH